MRVGALLAGAALSACSVVGVRTVEEPPFRVVAQAGGLEIRQYGPRIAAETQVDADSLQARSIGFRRIAGYIFGGNQTRASIAMTAPVAQDGAQIAMTAPVAQTGGQRIQFFMPQGTTLATLPVPNDPAVQLVAVPEQTVAVLRFSGSIAPAAVQAEQQRLLAALPATGWRATGPVTAWFYDPPWTLPPFRRNEVAVPVSQP